MIRFIIILLLSSHATMVNGQLVISRNNTADVSITKTTDRDPKWLYISGQSNADGRVESTDWATALQDSLSQFKTWFQEDSIFYQGKAGFNSSDQSYWLKSDTIENGIEIALYDYLKGYASTWYVVKMTRGGAPISFFNMNSTSLNGRPGYSVQIADSKSFVPQTVSFTNSLAIWMQGETEAANADSTNASNYSESLEAIIADTRSQAGANIMFVIAGLNESLAEGSYPHQDIVFREQTEVASNDPNASIISTTGLTLIDNVHFDAAAYLVIAKRLAQKYYENYKKVLLR